MNVNYEEDAQDAPGGIVKKILYLYRRAPYGSIYAQEGLEVALIGAAFAQDVAMAFIDDGVYQLIKDQDTSDSGMKNFSPAYRALDMYEIEKRYVERESLEARGLELEDLLVPVVALDSTAMSELIDNQDVLLNF